MSSFELWSDFEKYRIMYNKMRTARGQAKCVREYY